MNLRKILSRAATVARVILTLGLAKPKTAVGKAAQAADILDRELPGRDESPKGTTPAK